MAFTNDSIFSSHTSVRQNENYTKARLGAEEGLSYLSVDYFQPKKILAPSLRMQMFNPIPFVAMLLFKLSKWG